MSQIVEFNKSKRVRDEASVWLVRLQEGLSQQQQKELRLWLDIDVIHQAQLLELATVWDELEVLTELAPLFEGVSAKEPDSPGVAETAKRPWLSAGIAASLLLVCGALALLFIDHELITQSDKTMLSRESHNAKPVVSEPKHKQQSQAGFFQTPIGEQLEVELSDGSRATLNTDTRIELEFTDQQRTIKLLKGEAHFDVYKDPNRPLVVMVSGKSVQAVGTAFSVRKNNDTQIEVAVDEGRVAVYKHDAALTKADQAQLAASLAAGEVLTLTDDDQQLVQYDLDEMADRLAWKQGMIVINDETLDYVLQEFSRYSKQKVLLADRTMGETRVAGYFRLGDVDALLVALEENFKIRSEYYKKSDTFVLSQL